MNDSMPEFPALSLTVTMIGYTPAEANVRVPSINPVVELIIRPGGKLLAS